MTQQEIPKAVVVLRDEDCHSFALVSVHELPTHPEAARDLGDPPLEGAPIGLEFASIEMDSLKELALQTVPMLVGGEDVGPVPRKGLGQGSDDPLPVWAANEQRREMGRIPSRIGHGGEF